LQQLISAIKYLADVGVSHRDLKPENILFDKDFKLKVSDFGLSRNAEGDNKDFKLFSKVGTEGYKPPEMELGKYTGLQSDIFATGVVLFIMYNGTPPFMSTKAHDKIYKLIREKNFPKFWSLHEKSKPLGFYPDSFKRLLNSFFSAEPDRRPTF
jgi:serine/threonine protein kinase